MTPDRAELIAIGAIGWILSSDTVTTLFLRSTGLEAVNIKTELQNNFFLISVLEFLLTNDDWVRGYCVSAGLIYDEPMEAKRQMCGDDLPNWT
jgi:hypothetical protein